MALTVATARACGEVGEGSGGEAVEERRVVGFAAGGCEEAVVGVGVSGSLDRDWMCSRMSMDLGMLSAARISRNM